MIAPGSVDPNTGLGGIDLFIHGANVAALLGMLWALIKVAVPTGLSVRDSLRDTASQLATLVGVSQDHEKRLREVERDSATYYGRRKDDK